MAMTVVVTRDVPERTRGFLASVMPEPAPGVYVSGDLSKAVRERLWTVMRDWHDATGRGSVVIVWKDDKQPGGLGLDSLGTPPRRLADLGGVLVSMW